MDNSLIIKRKNFIRMYVCLYTLAICFSNWLDVWQIRTSYLQTGCGSLIFPFSYLISDNITEIYGFKYARYTIWTGLITYFVIVALGGALVSLLPFEVIPKAIQPLFIFNQNIRIAAASVLSYFFTEKINSKYVSKLKVYFKGEYMGIRFLLATLSAHFFNELIYAPIAFNNISTHDLLKHTVSSWEFMVSIEIILLPFFIKLAKKIKSIEKFDIYDHETKYNLFSLNTVYKNKDNFYQNKNS